jgi:chemotaxis methyl-accepting protein methylase
MMMEMIYRNKPDGDGKLGKIMDGWFLASPAADAVRERRKLLAKILTDISRAKVKSRGDIRIMNLACGSNRELFDFLAEFESSQAVEALCIDIDPDALAYTNRHVNVFNHQATVRLMNENIVKWALGRVRHDFGRQDIIYSSGLTDYLDRRLFVRLIDRCYSQLRDEGVLIVGNFSPNNPNRQFMDHILHWTLIYRDAQELREIFKETAFGDNVEVVSETHGINLFVIATRR